MAILALSARPCAAWLICVLFKGVHGGLKGYGRPGEVFVFGGADSVTDGGIAFMQEGRPAMPILSFTLFPLTDALFPIYGAGFPRLRKKRRKEKICSLYYFYIFVLLSMSPSGRLTAVTNEATSTLCRPYGRCACRHADGGTDCQGIYRSMPSGEGRGVHKRRENVVQEKNEGCEEGRNAA